MLLSYNEQTGKLTDAVGKNIAHCEELRAFPIQAAKPTIPLPIRQSPLGDIIRLKEAGFSALDIIALKNSNTY